MARKYVGHPHSGKRPLDMPNWLKPEEMDFERKRIPPTSITPHTSRHEEDGADELNIEGLEGESDEMRKLREELYLKDMKDTYDKLMSHEMYASDRRGFEIR